MSSADFWARKLGGQPQQQQQAPPAPARPRPTPPQNYVPPQQYIPPQQEAQPAPSPDEKRSFVQAMNTWGLKGGQAQRQEAGSTCPSCGSGNMFQMSNAGALTSSVTGMMTAPSSRCFECGWRPNGMVQGQQSNWG